jgi:hypothetical protein
MIDRADDRNVEQIGGAQPKQSSMRAVEGLKIRSIRSRLVAAKIDEFLLVRE